MYSPIFPVIYRKLKGFYQDAMKSGVSSEEISDALAYISALRDLKKTGGLSSVIEGNLHLDITDILTNVKVCDACTEKQRKIFEAMINLKRDFSAKR